MFRDRFKLPLFTLILGMVSLTLSAVTTCITMMSCLNDEPFAYMKLFFYIALPSGLLGVWCMKRCAQALITFNNRPYI